MTIHAIRCKRTGEALADKLDGGTCLCPSADECRVHPQPGTTPAGASGPVTTGDQGVVGAAHTPGPMARARKIVEGHVATFGAIPRDHWLVSAIADDLAFVELASKPHRDERAELIAALKHLIDDKDTTYSVRVARARAVLTKVEGR